MTAFENVLRIAGCRIPGNAADHVADHV
jgi:hypothetical protein